MSNVIIHEVWRAISRKRSGAAKKVNELISSHSLLTYNFCSVNCGGPHLQAAADHQMIFLTRALRPPCFCASRTYTIYICMNMYYFYPLTRKHAAHNSVPVPCASTLRATNNCVHFFACVSCVVNDMYWCWGERNTHYMLCSIQCALSLYRPFICVRKTLAFHFAIYIW